jgi:putative tryptophan/tyrosine transport system substrate-binding protein
LWSCSEQKNAKIRPALGITTKSDFVFAQPRPRADLSRIEIPRRSKALTRSAPIRYPVTLAEGQRMQADRFRRREFIILLGGAAAAWPLATRAQQRERMRRLGFLGLGVPGDAFGKDIAAALSQGLDALGWKEGINLHIDWRWYGADAALVKRQVTELVALKPDVLLVGGNPAVEEVRQQAKALPVVFALVSDPVGMGYVESLAHPGGNITGFMSYDPPIYTKQLQMLTEITPPARTVAVLYNPKTAPYASRMLRTMNDAAKSIGVTVRDAACQDDIGIEAAMTALVPAGDGGLLALGDIFNQVHRDVIVALALKYNIPTVVNTRQITESGGLMSYALDIPDLFRRSAGYVDRVLKGAKPADLPVQAPTKFELTINLKTARALGRTIPQWLLANADTVIE